MSADLDKKTTEVVDKASQVADKVVGEGVKLHDGSIVKPKGLVASKAAAGVRKAADESKTVEKARADAKRVDASKYMQHAADNVRQAYESSPLKSVIEDLDADEDDEMDVEEVASALTAIVEHMLGSEAKVTGVAQAATEALAKRVDVLANSQAHTASKLSKNLARVCTQLEKTGLFSSDSMMEDVKRGKLHIKNHVVDLGSLFASIILMKSMRSVVTTVKDDDDGSTISLNNVTDMFYEKGRTSFIANPTLTVNHAYATVSQAGAGNPVIVAKKTPTELDTVDVALTDLEDDVAYLCSICYLNDTSGGTLVGNTTQLVLTGAELKDTTAYKLIPASAFTLSGTTNSSILAASLDQTGIGNVFICQELKPSGENLRITGAIDLQGAAKVAGWAVGTNFSDWWSVLFPWFSNSLGNILTDVNLPDFLGKNAK
jgi:hypothetical protein